MGCLAFCGVVRRSNLILNSSLAAAGQSAEAPSVDENALTAEDGNYGTEGRPDADGVGGREGTMQHLWGHFEVYVMAENDLTLAARSLARSVLRRMELKRVNFVVMLIAKKERERLRSSLPKVLFDT